MIFTDFLLILAPSYSLMVPFKLFFLNSPNHANTFRHRYDGHTALRTEAKGPQTWAFKKKKVGNFFFKWEFFPFEKILKKWLFF